MSKIHETQSMVTNQPDPASAAAAQLATQRHESLVHRPDVTHRQGDRTPYSCVMADAPSTFAELIANGRRRKNWSQEDLETHSGVSRSTISRWERGLADKPEPEHVRAVCAALGVDPRRAAVSLGYLTSEEIAGSTPLLDPAVEEVLDILQDPAVSEDEKTSWIGYLKYLRDKAHRHAS